MTGTFLAIGPFRGIGFSSLTVMRVLSVTIAVAAVVSGILKIGQIEDHASFFQINAYCLLLALFFVPPLVSALLSIRGTIGTIGVVNGALAACRLAALVVWAPLMSAAGIPSGLGAPWAATLICVSAAAAAIAWSPRVAWSYLIATCIASFLARVLSAASDVRVLAAMNAFDALAYAAILTALVIAVKKSGHGLDTIASGSALGDAAEAVAAARFREQARAQRMMHDSILATLVLASRDEPALRAPLAREAQNALVELHLLGSYDSEITLPSTRAEVSSAEFTGTLLTSLRTDAPHLLTDTDVDSGSFLPADVAGALIDAASEALRNSLRHAPGAERSVTVTLKASGVSVVVADDGPGFDLLSVPGSRMGVSGSIVERMHALPGGTAEIDSRTNGGCRVILGWSRG